MLTDRRFSSHRERTRAPVLLDALGQYMYLRRRRRWNALLSTAGIEANGNRFINMCFEKPSVSRHNAIENCISLFNRLSEEVIDPRTAKGTARDHNLQILLSMYEAYLGSLANGNELPRTDLSLLQQKALERLSNNESSGGVFKHVIVDEYQDTNTVQERLFFRLASGHKNICVVGDDDQALYRFRGATVENFVGFPSRCQEHLGQSPHKIVLSSNYRSRRQIVIFIRILFHITPATGEGVDQTTASIGYTTRRSSRRVPMMVPQSLQARRAIRLMSRKKWQDWFTKS
jgi:DNA helicase-2/ATP-dependent DNA helicase PcrA